MAALTMSVCGFVRLMVLINTAVISPAHTDSSKTAARYEFMINIIIDRMALVIPNAIADFKRSPIRTVHTAKTTRDINIINNMIS